MSAETQFLCGCQACIHNRDDDDDLQYCKSCPCARCTGERPAQGEDAEDMAGREPEYVKQALEAYWHPDGL